MRLFALLLAVMMVTGTAMAASPWTEEGEYWDKTREKFIFGFKNVAGGWTELFSEPAASLEADENVLNGLGRGLYNALVYTVGGALHLVTFPIPIDVPIPDNGIDL